MDTLHAPAELEPPAQSRRSLWSNLSRSKQALIILAVVATVVLSILNDKVLSTIITVVIAVSVCAGIWIGANLLFDQVQDRWQRFETICFGLFGALVTTLLVGNRLTVGSDNGFFAWAGSVVAGAALFAVVGMFLSSIEDVGRRLTLSTVVFGAIGVVAGLLIRDIYQPGVDWLATVAYTVAVAAIAGGVAVALKRPPVTWALVGAALGWLLGYWGGADLGDGNIGTAVLGAAVPALLIGARVGMLGNPDYNQRQEIETASRAWIFLGPALLFIMIMLVVPAIRTAYLSFLDRDSEEFVGFDNYTATFTDKASWDLTNWTDTFTSWPFMIGVGVLIIAALIGVRQKQVTGRAVELGNPTMLPLVGGFLFVCFGAFTAMRGTIINNLWWVVTVTFFSTALGLAIAVLADGRGGEKIAKSIIFMPMALSLVGASIIWRFVYQTRDISKEQTGIANALWIGLGRLSTGSGLPTLIGAIVLGVLVLVIGTFLARSLVRRAYGRAAVPAVLLIFAVWIFIRYTQIIGGGIGGFAIREDGEVVGQTIVFTQENPYNNFWLMVILIWIQVGFAMVILSAAIKAVPTELIEAARIDGATDSQVFWRVTLPQIGTTIGVVVTTLIVGVMKVYDIVKVVTNGQFGTQVLANDMFEEAFSFFNVGRGAALAMLIFVSVLPVMIINIRRMQREA